MLKRICELAALAFLLTYGLTLDAGESPNVILVMCDDLGWGDPQSFDTGSAIQTPHIDSMAAAGLKLTRFYAAAPVCSPTRGSCLTGRHPSRYGIPGANAGHLRGQEITLPELLRHQGYATGHFGKWHLGTLTTDLRDSNRGGPKNRQHFAPPRDHGYDVSFVTEAKVPTYDPMIKPPNAGGKAWDFVREGERSEPYGTRYWDTDGNIVLENLEGDDSRIIMDRAVPFIEAAAKREQPFFAAIWFHAPHLPVVAGPKHLAPYQDRDVYERNYFGCVTALDEQVGRLRAKLRELEIAENTMLWFCSDNGPEGQTGKAPGSAGPYRGRKRSLYEGGVRVPGILEWPAKVRAGETDFPAVTSDYLPTIADVLGIDLPPDRPFDGISLLPLLEGRAERRERPIGFHSKAQRTWVSHQYKIYSSDAGQSWELYDLLDDPGEEQDLAGKLPQRVAQMEVEWNEWHASCIASDAGRDYK